MGEVIQFETEGSSALAASSELLTGFPRIHEHIRRRGFSSIPGVERSEITDDTPLIIVGMDAAMDYHPADSSDRLRKLQPPGLDPPVGRLTPNQETEVAPPPLLLRMVREKHTAIDLTGVKRILDRHNDSTPEKRISWLMQYAFDAQNEIESAEYLQEPPRKRYQTPEEGPLDILAWVTRRKRDVERILRDKYEKSYLEKDTEGFTDNPWLANADRIAKLMNIASSETEIAAASVRLILLEDDKTRKERAPAADAVH